MNISELRTIHASERAQVGLNRIRDVIAGEPTMLHPDVSGLQESYRKGLAVALVHEGDDEAVGLARFIPLLDKQLIHGLGLGEFPQIWELGSVIIDLPYRGKGHASNLNNALISSAQDEMQDGNLLVLGTTKTARMLGSLHAASSLGFNFHAGSHAEFPMIAPFTCVCVPDFGEGFQLTPDCSQRIQENQLIALEEIKEGQHKTEKIPCSMFISDRDLARDVNDRLQDRFSQGEVSPQLLLVSALIKHGYYE